MPTLARPFTFAAVAALLLAACATGPKPTMSAPLRHQFLELYEQQDWVGADDVTRQLLDECDLGRADAETDSEEDLRSLWLMHDAATRCGRVHEVAGVLVALAARFDVDAPFQLVKFAREHGVETLRAAGVLGEGLVPDESAARWLAIADACAGGDFAGCRTRIDADSAGALEHFLLGDLLREAGRLEPALVEYGLATYKHSRSIGRLAERDIVVGNVRIESLLYEMGQPVLALEAMKIVNRDRPAVSRRPPSAAEDQRLRARLDADARLLDQIQPLLQRVPEPKQADLVAALAGVAGVTPVVVEGRVKSYRAPNPALTLALDDEKIDVQCSTDSAIGSFQAAWTTQQWLDGPACFEYTGSGPTGPRCVRVFADGAVFLGTVGFESHGILFRRGEAPHVGFGHYGRPIAEGLKVEKILVNEVVAGSAGETKQRRRLIARMADRSVFIGEGLFENRGITLDGPAQLTYAGDEWFASRFTDGVPGPWRRAGTLVSATNKLRQLTDVNGRERSWLSPAETMARLDEHWAQQDHLERVAAQEREQLEAARATAWREYLEESQRASDLAAELARENESGQQDPPMQQDQWCTFCSGTGSQTEMLAEQDSYAARDLMGGMTRTVFTTRYVPSRRTCFYCGGDGRR